MKNGGEHVHRWITLCMNFGDAKYIVFGISITSVRSTRNNNNNNGLNILYLIIGVILLSPRT